MTPARTNATPTLLSKLVLLEPGEGRAVLSSASYFYCILFGYFLLRPVRDAFGISGDLSDLPWLWTGTTAAMLIAVPAFAWLVSRMPRRRFIPLAYHFFTANLLIFYALIELLPDSAQLGVGYAFYIWLSVFNLFAVSIFWGFMADLWRTEQSKRVFAFIAVGGTLGATTGSAVPAFLAEYLGADHLMLFAALMLQIAVLFVRILVPRPAASVNGTSAASAAASAPTREPSPSVWAGFVQIWRSPYLQAMAAYMLFYTVTSTFLYFEQARIVKATFESREVRTAAFARIDLATNVITLIMQLFITSRVYTRLGVGVALGVLPVVTLAGFAAIWAAPELGWPIFVTFAVVQIARRSMHHAVDRPAREILYTPLGPDEKYKSKSFIDTFVYRGGDLLGAWAQAWKAVAAHAAPIAMGLSFCWLLCGLFLAARHRGVLRQAGREASAAEQGTSDSPDNRSTVS